MQTEQERLREALPEDDRDAFDTFVAGLEWDATLAKQESESALEDAQRDAEEARETLREVHEWFDDVLTLGKPMTDPRRIARRVEEAVRPPLIFRTK